METNCTNTSQCLSNAQRMFLFFSVPQKTQQQQQQIVLSARTAIQKLKEIQNEIKNDAKHTKQQQNEKKHITATSAFVRSFVFQTEPVVVWGIICNNFWMHLHVPMSKLRHSRCLYSTDCRLLYYNNNNLGIRVLFVCPLRQTHAKMCTMFELNMSNS